MAAHLFLCWAELCYVGVVAFLYLLVHTGQDRVSSNCFYLLRLCHTFLTSYRVNSTSREVYSSCRRLNLSCLSDILRNSNSTQDENRQEDDRKDLQQKSERQSVE